MSTKKTSAQETVAKKTAPKRKAQERSEETTSQTEPVPVGDESSVRHEQTAEAREDSEQHLESEDAPLKDEGSHWHSEEDATEKHFRVVEIATQLACAQITSAAYNEAAGSVISGVQSIASAFLMASARLKTELETLHKNPDLVDASFVDRACSDLGRAASFHKPPIQKPSSLNHPEHDALFEGAMIRAERLLRSPSEDTSLIYAEQIFEAEEVLSEKMIGDRFGCWPKLRNRSTFYPFMVRVECWLHDHLDRLHSPDEDKRFDEDAEMLGYILDLGRRRSENDLFRRIYELVRDHHFPKRPRSSWDNVEGFAHTVWTQSLVSVILCDRRPSHTRKGEPKKTRFYRPWGLFRFLRLHGDEDVVGRELLDMLHEERRLIAGDTIVYPLSQNFGMTTDFGPLNRMIKDGTETIMRCNAMNAALKLSAAPESINLVRTLSMPTPLIDEKFQKDVLFTARAGAAFKPQWNETIQEGFKALLLTGSDHPMKQMAEFLAHFHIPLIASYGGLRSVLQHRHHHLHPHELIDLFPAGWGVSLSESDVEPHESTKDPAGHRPGVGDPATSISLTLVIRSSSGGEHVENFRMLQSKADED